MSQPDNPAVPRFTSFRPKPPPSRKPQAAETPEHLHAPRERDHRHKYRPHQDHSKTSDAHESRRRHLRTGILLPNQEIPDVKRRPRSELEPSSRSLEHNQFTIDHKGDPQNLAYGRLHKYDVPQYRRSGHGRVLGLDTISRIDREASGESHVSISIPLLTNQSDQRILSSKAHKEFHSFRLVLPEHDRDSFDPDHDYLPLSRKRSTKRAPALSVLIEPIAENFQGKSPQGNLDSHGSSPESDIQTNSQDSDAENEARIESADEAVKSRNVLLSRLTATEPDNLSAWTDLIEHQEAMLMLGRSRNSREVQLNASERRTLADMRAIMYEKAIRACKTNRKSRIHLMVSQMEEIAEFWDGEKLSEKWQDLLHAEPDAAELWIKYLDFVQSDFTRFRYESCQAAFMKCLEVISSNITGANEQKEPFEALMELFVHVFARMTAMQQQAGYTEHALAHWQGVVEFSLYKPKALEGAALDKQIRAFEEFWDSEVPRLGEADAHGWGAFYDNEGEAPVPQSTEEAAPVQTGDGFADFGKSERALSEIHSRPGRTLDEAGQTDPYHIILFSDIHGMLDLLPYQLPAELLLQTLLCFFGLPLNPNYPNLVDQLSLDPFLMPKLLQASKGGTQGPHLGVSFYRQTTETLFSDAFNELDSNRHLAWARRSIESFVTIMPASDALAEYYVAFMSAQERMTPPQSDGLYKRYGSKGFDGREVLTDTVQAKSPKVC